MPYITSVERNRLNPAITALREVVKSQGDLAYAIYCLVLPSKRYQCSSAGRAVLKDVYDILTEELLDYERQKRHDNGGIPLL